MSPLIAFLLGVVEAMTEFLPVSSTGHLVLASSLFGHDDDASMTLSVVIQLGAVVAVAVYYRARLLRLARGLLRREPAEVQLALALGVAFLPAALVGLSLHHLIKEHLFGPTPIAIALIVGGVVMIVVEVFRARKPESERGVDGLEHVTWRRALWIGIAQCFSLWPGASRSMTTIVGGQLTGLSTATAAEFSFLLSIPVLGAATVFDLYKSGGALVESEGGAAALGIGMLTAFVVSLVVIAVFLRYLKRHGLAPFGVYRILLGSLVLLTAS